MLLSYGLQLQLSSVVLYCRRCNLRDHDGINYLPLLQAQNGVIHLIDTVLLPPAGFPDLPTLVALQPQLQVLSKVLGANALIPTLAG
jgi:hypothetical protein